MSQLLPVLWQSKPQHCSCVHQLNILWRLVRRVELPARSSLCFIVFWSLTVAQVLELQPHNVYYNGGI